MATPLASIRQETVERLAATYANGVPAFRQVFDSRQPQLRRDMLPAVRVYTSATSQGLSISIPEFRTTANLVVQIVGEDITDVRTAARIDELCEAAKTRLLCDPKWLVLFERVLSIDTEIDRNIEGEQRTTTATLTFALQYSEVYEPVIPDWLETIHMEVDVIDPAADPNIRHPGPDGRIEVAAEFINPLPPAEE